MANEVVITKLWGINGDRMEFAVAAGTAIPKGSIMKMTDFKTAIINSGAGDVVAGIAAWEKTATDGKTTMTIITNCEAKCVVEAGQTTTTGEGVRTSATENKIQGYTTLDNETGLQLGKALEDGAAAETVLVRIHTLI